MQSVSDSGKTITQAVTVQVCWGIERAGDVYTLGTVGSNSLFSRWVGISNDIDNDLCSVQYSVLFISPGELLCITVL